jgi:hypothetical protein
MDQIDQSVIPDARTFFGLDVARFCSGRDNTAILANHAGRRRKNALHAEVYDIAGLAAWQHFLFRIGYRDIERDIGGIDRNFVDLVRTHMRDHQGAVIASRLIRTEAIQPGGGSPP